MQIRLFSHTFSIICFYYNLLHFIAIWHKASIFARKYEAMDNLKKKNRQTER